jgi:hypothetical protein
MTAHTAPEICHAEICHVVSGPPAVAQKSALVLRTLSAVLAINA